MSNQSFRILVNQNKQCIFPYWFNEHYLELAFAFVFGGNVEFVIASRSSSLKSFNKPFWHLFDYELVTEPDGIYVRGDSTHTYALCARFDDGPVNSAIWR